MMWCKGGGGERENKKVNVRKVDGKYKLVHTITLLVKNYVQIER